MNNDDMRQPPSRCSSSSSITNNPRCMSNGHHRPAYYHGRYPFEYQRSGIPFRTADVVPPPPRKEVSNSIFSFLQRFRAKNHSIFEDVNSLPSSPRSSRVSSHTGHRWESVESILSSATATSFAFIPPYLHQPSTQFSHKSSKSTNLPPNQQIEAVENQRAARETCAFLRKKYNLHGSDATLYHYTKEPTAGGTSSALGIPAAAAAASAKRAKKLHRNSVGNVENLAACWPDKEYPFNRVRPYSEGIDTLQVQRSHCHRPGKRRAPQPPLNTHQISAKVHRRPSGARKKRKAPTPPKSTMSDGNKVGLDHAGAIYNDSLKLERGVLKANKQSVASPAMTEASSVPVSPKPWYKRSSTQPNLKSVAKSADKKKSCEQLLDEWMLEAGLPRSTSFYERKLVEPLSTSASSNDAGNPKRRSQISMLANISELDREAAEIVQQERRRKEEATHSMDDKFYAGTNSAVWLEEPPNRIPESVGDATSKQTTPKDLISILNAITNATRITVNTTFFKETLSKSPSASTIGHDNSRKSTRSVISSNKQPSNRLTITELEDFDKETHQSSPAQEQLAVAIKTCNPEPPVVAAEKTTEPQVKPVKPFSSWTCPQCTLENPSWKFICEACNKWRPYSVNRAIKASSVITPKEDAQLKLLTDKRSANVDDISRNVGQKIVELQKSLPKTSSDLLEPLPTASVAIEAKVDQSYRDDAQILEKMEQVRKARLAFFTKTRLNDLNITDDELVMKPSNANNAESKNNKCYSEEDRQKLREILKELKDSLPKSDLLGDKSSKRKVTVHSARNETKAFSSRMDRKNKISNINKGVDDDGGDDNDDGDDGDTKSNEKAEAYFITKRAIVEEVPTSSTAATANMTSGKKVELKVPVVEHAVQNDGSIRTKVVDVEGIRICARDIHPAQNKPHPVEDTNVAVPQEMPSVPSDKQERRDGVILAAAEWKQNNWASPKEIKNLTSVTVNRLLKKLQTAIASGQHHEAANIARDLARLKVNCNMTRQDTPDIGLQASQSDEIQNISIDIHVHEKGLSRDPIRMKISPHTTIDGLQTKISKEHDIPVTSQQLIFGKHPITDATATLDQIGVNSSGMIMFLKVLKSENTEPVSQEKKVEINRGVNDTARTSQQHITELFDNVTKQSDGKVTKAIINDSSANTSTSVNSSTTTSTSTKVPLATASTSKVRENAVCVSGSGSPSESKLSNSNIVSEVKFKDTEDEVKLLQTGSKQPLGSASEWVCAACTLINEERTKICAVCGRVRPENSASLIEDAKPKTSNENKQRRTSIEKPSSYHELMDLEKTDLIANVGAFDCAVCLVPYDVGEGVVLKECLHTFCRDCLGQTIEHCAEAEVKCPYRDAEYSCESVLQEREIKALVTAETFEKHLARSISEAENKIKNTFHCKTANCRGWCIFEDNVNEFHCPVCSKTNCLTCQVIHSGLNCKQYQEIINKESETSADANRTRLMLQEMLQKGEAMTCPTCEVILMKKWGCDWLRCSMCKTEICWVTRGPRWGPMGKGDTSGGCRCGVNGVKCHQRCTFCH